MLGTAVPLPKPEHKTLQKSWTRICSNHQRGYWVVCGKAKFMYAVFEKTLLTDKGKTLVCQHQLTSDAQLIYKELSAHTMLSTKAAINAGDLHSYITSTTLADGKWKGPTHLFVLYWQDQVQKAKLSPQTALSPTILLSLLQNAVNPISE